MEIMEEMGEKRTFWNVDRKTLIQRKFKSFSKSLRFQAKTV